MNPYEESPVSTAIITGNLFTGPAQMENASKGDVQIGLNAGLGTL
jgi:hypothetical protein